MNKCTMSIPSKVGHIHNNKPIRGIDDPAVLLHRGLCCHTQPPSPLRHSWWAQPHHQGGGGEDGGWETQTASTQREKERERRDGCCLLWHTHASLSNSGRTERASFPHPLQESKSAFSFEWIIEALARLYISQHNQSLRHCRGATEPRVEALWKQKDPSAPGTATMAPMVEEGSQFGESRSPFNTFTRPALNVALNPMFVAVLMEQHCS